MPQLCLDSNKDWQETCSIKVYALVNGRKDQPPSINDFSHTILFNPNGQIARSLYDQIDRKTCCLLLEGNVEKHKLYKFLWEEIIKSKDERGLGLRSMRQVNATFMQKLGWRLLTEKYKLWSQLLRAKYCNCRWDMGTFSPKQHILNTWKGIL